jgi:hypothetical protein
VSLILVSILLVAGCVSIDLRHIALLMRSRVTAVNGSRPKVGNQCLRGIDAQREAVLLMREQGTIDDDVLRSIERELDLEEVHGGMTRPSLLVGQDDGQAALVTEDLISRVWTLKRITRVPGGTTLIPGGRTWSETRPKKSFTPT